MVGVALGYDDHLYVLEGRSANMGANDWGRTACRLALELRVTSLRSLAGV
ncbi:hypothetical protein [Kitasatospora sp. NPDC059160]